MRKIISVLMTLALCISLCPITRGAVAYGATYSKLPEVSETYINPLYADVLTEEDLVKPAGTSYGPATLADETPTYLTSLEEAGAVMREGMKNRQTEVVVYYKTSEDRSTLMRDIGRQALAHTGVPTEGDYLRFQYGGWGSGMSGYLRSGVAYLTITYTITYYTTAAQETEMDAAVAQAMSAIGIQPADAVSMKIKRVYDYVTSHVTYDYTNLNDATYKLKYSAYAALINGTSVCQGYANLMYRLLLTAGIDCRIIAGTGNGGAHAWNIVRFQNQYYDLDATWDAGRSSYSYFMKIDADFGNHQRGGDDGDSSTDEIDYTADAFAQAYPMASSSYSGNFDEHEHAWNDGVVTTAAKCTDDGLMTYTCTTCGESYTETIKATGHSAVPGQSLEAYCTAPGLTAGSFCENCGATLEEQKVIPAKGHGWNDGVVTTAATCTVDGVKTYTCGTCGETRTEVIAATGHKTVTDAGKAASCTESGLTEGSHCETCGEVFTAQSVIPAKGHSWNDGVVTTEPSCSKEGTKVYTCTTCGDTYTEAIACTSHIEVTDEAVSATLTSDGLTAGSHCEVCGQTLVAQEILYMPTCIKLSTTTYTYDGKVKSPTLTICGKDGKPLSSEYYTVTKASGRKYVGTYSYKVNFCNGYEGTKSVSFTINPKSTSISKLTGVTKGFKVVWKKQSTQTTGYQIRYSTSSKMTSAKTVTISKNSTTSKTISKLSKKKTYYVQVRTYKTVSGKKYYSSWSAKKSVKTR